MLRRSTSEWQIGYDRPQNSELYAFKMMNQYFVAHTCTQPYEAAKEEELPLIIGQSRERREETNHSYSESQDGASTVNIRQLAKDYTTCKDVRPSADTLIIIN